jgi:DNA-binding IclR family transcriptional regulator
MSFIEELLNCERRRAVLRCLCASPVALAEREIVRGARCGAKQARAVLAELVELEILVFDAETGKFGLNWANSMAVQIFRAA